MRAPQPKHSRLARGRIRHRRYSPKSRAFSLQSYHLLLDIDEAPHLDGWLRAFGFNRRALASLWAADHFSPARGIDRAATASLRERVEHVVNAQGFAVPGGRIELHTNLRTLGYVFNPISWWFLYDRDDVLTTAVAEVNNTFGDHYSYVLPVDDGRVHTTRDKKLHVSPFMEREPLQYGFRVRRTDTGLAAHIDVIEPDGKVRFDATTTETLEPLTRWTLVKMQLRHPLVTITTILRIHTQALRIWLTRTAPFHTRPAPAPNNYLGADSDAPNDLSNDGPTHGTH